MARHKVVSVRVEAPSNPRDVPHVSHIGTSLHGGGVEKTWTVDEVAAAIEAGEEFYTRRPATTTDGTVYVVPCHMCSRPLMRTAPGTEDYNRLEQHPRLR